MTTDFDVTLKIKDIRLGLKNETERNIKDFMNEMIEIYDEQRPLNQIREVEFKIKCIKKLMLLKNKLKRLESHIENYEMNESELIYELEIIEYLTSKPKLIGDRLMEKLEIEENAFTVLSYWCISSNLYFDLY